MIIMELEGAWQSQPPQKMLKSEYPHEHPHREFHPQERAELHCEIF
jgi:hypothetical protein